VNQREKALLGGIVGLLALWGVWRGYSSYEAGYDRRVTELTRLDDDLFDVQLAAREARRALRRLERYQEQSLPTDLDVAQSAYRAWLVETVAKSGLELINVKSSPSRRGVDEAATALEFDLNASGAPEAVAKFLDAYYRLDLLHKIASFNLTPAGEEGEDWGVTLKSVALAVEGAERQAGLPEEPREPSRLALDSGDAYAESLGGRNLFARYTPPPPPRKDPPKVVREEPEPKPSPPPFDDSEHAQLTGIVETGDGLQAWVVVRTTGETLRLRRGDELEVGQMKGRVLAVERRDLLLELEDGGEWRVSLGEKLREGRAVAPTGEA